MSTKRSAPVAPEDPGGTRARILDAAVSWAAVTGFRKLSMDEIARQARVGRATLYKYFPGRDALIAATVQTELARFSRDVQTVIGWREDPDDRLIYGFAHAYRLLRQHPALSTILKVNPQVILPYIVGDSYALNLGRAFVEAALNIDDIPGPARSEFAEHVTRAIHTLILIPSTVIDLDSPDGPEDYARCFLIPVKTHLIANVSNQRDEQK